MTTRVFEDWTISVFLLWRMSTWLSRQRNILCWYWWGNTHLQSNFQLISFYNYSAVKQIHVIQKLVFFVIITHQVLHVDLVREATLVNEWKVLELNLRGWINKYFIINCAILFYTLLLSPRFVMTLMNVKMAATVDVCQIPNALTLELVNV